MGIYCGPKRAAKVEELGELERRGWVLEPKTDGWYCHLLIGGGGRVAVVRLRSGRVYLPGDVERSRGRHPAQDVVGLRTGWAPGTEVVGELAVGTPWADRWRREHGGVAGVTLYDVVRVGDERALFEQLARGENGAGGFPGDDGVAQQPQHARRALLEALVERLGGRAARTLFVAPVRRRRLRDAWEKWVASGEEGAVAKDPNAPAGKGMLKVKRRDAVTCQVVELHDDVVRLLWGGRVSFYATRPRFEVAVGALVDVRCVGFTGEDAPRHAVIERRRDDLTPTGAADSI